MASFTLFWPVSPPEGGSAIRDGRTGEDGKKGGGARGGEKDDVGAAAWRASWRPGSKNALLFRRSASGSSNGRAMTKRSLNCQRRAASKRAPRRGRGLEEPQSVRHDLLHRRRLDGGAVASPRARPAWSPQTMRPRHDDRRSGHGRDKSQQSVKVEERKRGGRWVGPGGGDDDDDDDGKHQHQPRTTTAAATTTHTTTRRRPAVSPAPDDSIPVPTNAHGRGSHSLRTVESWSHPHCPGWTGNGQGEKGRVASSS